MATSIQNWYEGSGIRIPAYFGSKALAFARETTGIVRSVIDNRLAIIFPNALYKRSGGIGYADQKGKIIAVDGSLLAADSDGDETRKALADRELTVFEALAIVHGTVVHESLHFLLTPANLFDIASKETGIKRNTLLDGVMNIVEDVYIERYGIEEFPELAWMLTEYWEIFMPASLPDKVRKGWSGEAPTNNEELRAAVNFLVCLKNQTGSVLLRTEFEEALRDLVYSVRGVDVAVERTKIVGEIYRLLIQNMPKKDEQGEDEKKPEEKKENGEGQGQGQDEEYEEGEGSGGEGEGEGEGETTPENVDEGNLDVETDTKTVPHFIIDETKAEMASEIRRQRNTRFTFENVTPSEVGPTVVNRFVGETGATLNYDKHWLEFAKMANTHASARSVTGPAKFSGNRLSHAENMFTNDPQRYGKVYSNARIESKNGVASNGKARVVLLVDCSGSMDNSRSYGESKMDKAISAAYGAVVGFEKAGIPIAVYGFTTASFGDSYESPLMFVFKEFEDSYRTGKEALAAAHGKMNGLMANNPDSVAIDFAAKKLAPATGTKVMIVISDGQPHANVYRGTMDATEETVKAVKNARKQGIQVWSVSIDIAALHSCNEIYGEKFNVRSDDPNAAISIVKSIF